MTQLVDFVRFWTNLTSSSLSKLVNDVGRHLEDLKIGLFWGSLLRGESRAWLKLWESSQSFSLSYEVPNLRGPFEVSIMEDPIFEVPLRYQSWRTQPSRSRKWKIVGKRLWVAVWPDLAKLRHFGKNLEVWRALDGVYFVFGLILSPLG